MHEIIRIGDLTVTFLKSSEDTAGQFCLCEFNVPPHQQNLLSHSNTTCDEIILGMAGTTSWTVGETQVDLGSGERLFIPRGLPHAFGNHGECAARFLCIYTPAAIDPELFRALAEAHRLGPEERLPKIGSVMHRFHLIPVAPN